MFQPVVDSGFHVLALINACYSGDFLKLSFGGKRFIPKYPGAHAITAGGTNELTWHDGTIGSGSVFFETLYAALDGRAGRDGIVTVNDLFAYLQREVQISTDQQQNPRPGDLRRGGSSGGFFFFNRSPLVERGILPAWDADKGVPFGPEPGAAGAPPKDVFPWLTAAQAKLGVFYRDGVGGVPQDDREAARLYKLAADQGNAYAQAGLKRLAP
jgi:hypothetical protein